MILFYSIHRLGAAAYEGYSNDGSLIVSKVGFPRIPHFQLRTNTAIIEFLANICAFIRNYAHYKKRGDMRINAH